MELKEAITDIWNESADGYNLYIQDELNSFKKYAWTEMILKDERKYKIYGKPFESYEKEIPDEFYKFLPLSSKLRPKWDKDKLEELGYRDIKIDTEIIDKVYDKKEILLYGCTTSFKIVAIK